MSGPRSSERIWSNFHYKTWDFSPPTNDVEQIIRSRNTIYETEGHDYHNLGPHGPDKGGPFYLVTHDYSEQSNFVPSEITGWFFHYFGDQKAWSSHAGPDDTSVWQPLSASSRHDLEVLGTSAIAKVIPTNPVSDLATFLGEMKEGIPSFALETLRSRTRIARNAGKDYLNYQFGWKPLVSDVKKFARVASDFEKILRDYEQQSGKQVRRRLTVTNAKQSSTYTWLDKPKPYLPFWISAEVTPGQMTATVDETVRQWFSGAFTYFLPRQGRKSFLQKANKLLGIRLTPEVLWNVAPWSWAIDWVSNAGDILHNTSAFARDGLTMPYAYMMEEKTISVKYDLRDVYYSHINGGTGTRWFTQTFSTITKRRVGATPFGFGLIPEVDFTNRQKAIVASLGLTKGRRGKS